MGGNAKKISKHIDLVASKSAIKLDKLVREITGKGPSVVDVATFLAYVTVRFVRNTDDAKAAVQAYAICLNNAVNLVIESKKKGASLQGQGDSNDTNIPGQ